MRRFDNTNASTDLGIIKLNWLKRGVKKFNGSMVTIEPLNFSKLLWSHIHHNLLKVFDSILIVCYHTTKVALQHRFLQNNKNKGLTMKKLASWRDMRVGIVYNRVYIGENTAYGRINGKETFLVLETAPLQTVELFSQFANAHTDDLRSSTTTFDNPDIAFKEFDVFEPENEGEWFKKSIKFSSLADPLNQGLITRANIELVADWRGRCPFTVTWGDAQKMLGVECGFGVEDQTMHPLLQTVFIVWPNWVELRADFKKLGIEVRT